MAKQDFMRAEFFYGPAYGTHQMFRMSKTAEEIKASKQRSYSTVDIYKNHVK